MRLPTAIFTKLFNQQFRGPVSRNINRSFYATMRAARYYGIKDIRVEQVPEPSVQPGQVKVDIFHKMHPDIDTDKDRLPLNLLASAAQVRITVRHPAKADRNQICMNISEDPISAQPSLTLLHQKVFP